MKKISFPKLKKLSYTIFCLLLLISIIISTFLIFCSKKIIYSSSQNEFFYDAERFQNKIINQINSARDICFISSCLTQYSPLSNGVIDLSLISNNIKKELTPFLLSNSDTIKKVYIFSVNDAIFSSAAFVYQKNNNNIIKNSLDKPTLRNFNQSPLFMSLKNNNNFFGISTQDNSELIYSEVIKIKNRPAAVVVIILSKTNLENELSTIFGKKFFSYEIVPKNNTLEIPKSLFSSSFLLNNSSLLIISAKKNDYFKDFYSIYFIISFVIISLLLFTVISAIYFNKKITNPILRLAFYLNSAAKGNYSLKFSSFSDGEIGKCEKNLNSLLTTLEKTHSNLVISKVKSEYSNYQKNQYIKNIYSNVKESFTKTISILSQLNSNYNSSTQKTLVSRCLEFINENITLFNELNDYIKYETGDDKLSYKKCDIKKIIQDLSLNYSTNAKLKGVSLFNYSDKNIPSTLLCDEEKLVLTLRNLIDNSVKYCESGSITITVLIIDSTLDSCTVNFSITDTGAGLSKDSFDLYIKNHIHKTGNTMGLGLYIANKNLEMLGSFLEFDENIKVGTRIFFSLKLKNENISSEKTQKYWENNLNIVDSQDFFSLSLYGKNIFLISHFEKTLEILSAYSSRLSATLLNSENIFNFIEVLDNKKIEILFIEIPINKFDILETLHLIKMKKNDSGKSIPVIAIGDPITLAEIQKYNNKDIDDYLTEPFNFDDFSAIIKKWKM